MEIYCFTPGCDCANYKGAFKMKTKTTTTNVAPFGAMIQIWKEDVKEGDKPIIQFGLKKAEAILASVEEIKKFVEENKK